MARTGLVIDIAGEDLPYLSTYAIAPTQYSCWSVSARKDQFFSDLLMNSGVVVSAIQSFDSASFSVASGPDLPDNLETYFHRLGEHVSKRFLEKDVEGNAYDAIIFNLMPFTLSITGFDKIAKGLFPRSCDFPPEGSTTKLVFLVRNVDWIDKSAAFKAANACGCVRAEVTAIDLRGFAIAFTNETGATRFVDNIPRSTFRSILDATPSKVYNSLIFGTNTFLGHFALRNSHVRTHYDLSEFISRDDVWEFFYHSLYETVNPESIDNVLLIGTGLEEKAVRRVGEQFAATLGERYSVTFEYCRTASELSSTVGNWSAKHNVAVIVTDIVNTGSTLKEFVSHLTEKNREQKPIKVYALAKMQNSPSDVSGVDIATGLTIRRDFYSKDKDKCILCQLEQPLTKVKAASDFCKIEPRQLTPFDFWEIVGDAKALRELEDDPQQRTFFYRVDTEKLLKRYGNWLKNIISNRYRQEWPSVTPDFLCTVEGADERTGLAFSRLVQNALGVQRIVSVPRHYFKHITPAAGLPQSVPNLFEHKSGKVLVVDDGINYGHTIKNLILYCRASGLFPMGILVLDCRLSPSEVARVTHVAGGAKLVSLYHWPSNVGNL